ncbi:hypothetical protein CEUSTIGMA_g5736.t1 [Chlamydomonas eustigma]|uniref:Mitochondrial carrier protein n=1 Tax=Chlamydomonas eustigma TaxID=1157962 RepID=A0A250X5D2_9CHLO|nr:hypothetical protein CEUSTIGMA_g5736.t1 [Chlamydomonas eustigma]|eukprot:GAX78294.1 hypothetical protein CEUSTIGMA_g5736.t1 [Chlamydomonas eustigma]
MTNATLSPPVVEVETSHSSTKQAEKKSKPPSIASALSGALSGVLIGTCLQPLDVVRTRMQGDSIQGLSRNTISTARVIFETQGVSGFWRGTGPTVIRLGLGVGLHMVLVENFQQVLKQQMYDGLSHLSSVNAAITGALSRATASLLMCPITMIKTRMEYGGTGAMKYKDTWHALVTISRTEGPQSLFRGLIPNIMTTAPFSGLYYMFYIRLKEGLAAEGRPQVLVNFSAGTVAAVAATLLTQPFDVIRTRVQLSAATNSSSATGGNLATGLVSGPLQALKETFSQGPRALFVGTLPRVLKRTGQTALVWTLYEELLPRLSAAYIGTAAAITASRQQDIVGR